MKLQLFLSHNGVLSRRKAFESILDGEVEVNGQKVKEPSREVDPQHDKVSYRGVVIAAKRFDYVMLNKPAGYVTTCEGQFDQRTVVQLLPRELRHLRPVGRLDKDTEGLLIFTNDGWLANRLMHPSFDVDKTYYARVRWRMKPDKVQRLEEGLIIDGERTAPAQVRILKDSDRESEVEITIHEGKKRQVRIMLSSVGNPVLQLRRLRQGALELGNLRSADWRRLTDSEVKALRDFRPRVDAGLGGVDRESRILRSTGARRSGGRGRDNERFGRRPAGKGSAAASPGGSVSGGKKYVKPNLGFGPQRSLVKSGRRRTGK